MTTARQRGASLPVTMVMLQYGRLYFSRDLYDRYFATLASVILMRRHADLLIMPVRHAAAGGYVIKIRNAAGDRLVEAPEFFRAYGLEGDTPLAFSVSWNCHAAALVAAGAFVQT